MLVFIPTPGGGGQWDGARLDIDLLAEKG